MRVGVLVSGGGTNLQALLDAIDDGRVSNAKIVTVVASRSDAFALERARKHDISCCTISRKDYASLEEYDMALTAHMQKEKVELIVLAGFLSILGEAFTSMYQNRILNIHPSLIPAFCGKGYYGIHVHEKVLEKGVKITGATVHFVNEEVDGGAILLQKAVEVKEDDTPEILQRRVMEQAEWIILPQAVDLFCNHKIRFINHHAYAMEDSL